MLQDNCPLPIRNNFSFELVTECDRANKLFLLTSHSASSDNILELFYLLFSY